MTPCCSNFRGGATTIINIQGGIFMARKTKSVSFDAMVKFFLRNYNIPTRKDVDKIITRLDRLEKLVKSVNSGRGRRGALGRPGRGRAGMTASDTVLEVIAEYKDGVGFAEIQNRTAFNEKKIRNIIFRLDKIGKIKRVSRGTYVAVPPEKAAANS
jgi:hypothetical protein